VWKAVIAREALSRNVPDMWWLRLRRLIAWLVLIGASAAYWVELAPFLHTKKQYIDAFIVFAVLFFGTLAALVLILRLPTPKGGTGN